MYTVWKGYLTSWEHTAGWVSWCNVSNPDIECCVVLCNIDILYLSESELREEGGGQASVGLLFHKFRQVGSNSATPRDCDCWMFNIQHQPNKPCFFLADHYVPPHVAAHFLDCGRRLQAITSASCLSVDVFSSLRDLPWTSWFSNHNSQLVSKLAMVQELLTPQAHGSFTNQLRDRQNVTHRIGYSTRVCIILLSEFEH